MKEHDCQILLMVYNRLSLCFKMCNVIIIAYCFFSLIFLHVHLYILKHCTATWLGINEVVLLVKVVHLLIQN